MNCCCASKTFCARDIRRERTARSIRRTSRPAGRLIDDELDGADRARLADWLRHDAAARNYYLRYLLTDTALQILHQAPAAGADRSTGFQPVGGRSWHGLPARWPGAAGNGRAACVERCSTKFAIHPRCRVPCPSSTLFSAGRPFLGVSLCYAFAALLIGAGGWRLGHSGRRSGVEPFPWLKTTGSRPRLLSPRRRWSARSRKLSVANGAAG